MLKKKDFRIEVFKHDSNGEMQLSGVKVIHLPTGYEAEAAQERSQIRNQRIAIERLLQQDRMISWMAIQIINDSMED